MNNREISQHPYRAGDRYDADKGHVVRERNDHVSGKWLLPLLIIPLIALGLWAGNNYLHSNQPNPTTTAQSNQYKAAPGVGGGPADGAPSPTYSVQSSNHTTNNTSLPQAGVGGSGADSSTTVPMTAPNTGHGGL